jgi:hypothetical protein
LVLTTRVAVSVSIAVSVTIAVAVTITIAIAIAVSVSGTVIRLRTVALRRARVEPLTTPGQECGDSQDGGKARQGAAHDS